MRMICKIYVKVNTPVLKNHRVVYNLILDKYRYLYENCASTKIIIIIFQIIIIIYVNTLGLGVYKNTILYRNRARK